MLTLRNNVSFSNASGSSRHVYLYVCILVLLIVLPWAVYAVINPVGFRNVDIFSYMPDSEQILQQGSIPSLNLIECQYYASFPIFTILIAFLSGILGVSSLQSAHIINIVLIVLFCLSIWLFVTKNIHNLPKTKFLFVGILLATFANPYFYGYFNTPLPQTMGLIVLLLLFTIRIPAQRSYSIIYLFLIMASLVHVSIIPFFLLIFVIFLTFKALTKQLTLTQSLSIGINRVLLPSVLFLGYLFCTIAIYPVAEYLQKTISFMVALAKNAMSGQVAITEGLFRGDLYPLNALGPALVIGATLSYLILYLQAIRNHQEKNDWIGAIAATSLLLILLGTTRGQFVVWNNAFFSISRYFNLPGFFMATIVTSFVIVNLLEHKTAKRMLPLIAIVLILPALGGLLDPLVF